MTPGALHCFSKLQVLPDDKGRPRCEGCIAGRVRQQASCLAAEGRQEVPGESPGAAAKGHEGQDPAAAGGGDRQGPDPGQGEVRVAGAARPRESAVIGTRPPVGRQTEDFDHDCDRQKAPPRAANQDPAPCIHEWNSLATAAGGLRARGGQGSETPTRPPGAPARPRPSLVCIASLNK